MSEVRQYVENLFSARQLRVAQHLDALFSEFVNEEASLLAVQQILANQKMLMENWKIKVRINGILQQQASIPNGNAGKPYEARLDLEQLGWMDLACFEWEGLEAAGLQFDGATGEITGMPVQGGDYKLLFKFRLEGESPETPLHEKKISFIVNADPKTLWKEIASDPGAPFAKEEKAEAVAKLGDKTLVVASKRGRSHANTGGFREDDFAFRHFDQTGWSIIAVADGAGSARLSRQGSRLACTAVAEHFEKNLDSEQSEALGAALQQFHQARDEEEGKKLSQLIFTEIRAAVLAAHKKIEEEASAAGASLKDFHTTLVFTLFKKFDFGYALLSFGVGDCPVALLGREGENPVLLSRLDVGEFSGGTRFLTMPEIFTNESFPSRISLKLVEDFSFLFLMTDGIYDPKFGVEANLEKGEKWKAFLDDLRGANEEGARVDLEPGNAEMGGQLLNWMDFWSPGNHDDRTLAIVF